MSEELMGVIGIAIATFISVTYNKAVKKSGSKKHRFIEKAKGKGCVTNGIAVSNKFRGGIHGHESPYMRADSRTVKYEYEVNGKKYYKKMEFQSPGMTYVNYPTEVTVYYDAANPKKAACREEATVALQIQSRGIGTILVWIVTAAIVINAINIIFN